MKIEHWYTTLAASMRKEGIFNCVLTNQSPIVSPDSRTINAIMRCIRTLELKTLWIFSLFPNSKESAG